MLGITLFAADRSRRHTGSRRQKIIQLSTPRTTGEMSLEKALSLRRSVRSFSDKKVEYVEIGQLLWAGQGITDTQRGFRTAPSAGAIYPMTLYLVLQEGLFVYKPKEHVLSLVLDDDIRERLFEVALEQQAVRDATCSIIIAGEVRKVSAKYGHKAKRFMQIEAGHIAQNIQLQATAMGLGTVPMGAFNIKGVAKACKMSPRFEPLYIMPIGYPKTPQTEKHSNSTEPDSEG